MCNKEEELSEALKKGLCFDSDSKSRNILMSDEIPTTLVFLECPFTWKYNFTSNVQDITLNIEEKLSEMENEDSELLLWKSFILNLILCYEYAREGDLTRSFEKQILCDGILDSISEDVSRAMVMGVGLRHISMACKCFLLYASNMQDEAAKICDAVVPFENMMTRDQASLYGAKGAYCAEYGYKGIKKSVDLLSKAVDMDECAEWYFLLGRSLGRLRRLERRGVIPDRRELHSLESCVQLSDKASYRVLLAQAYRETSGSVFHEKRGQLGTFKPYIDSLNKKSVENYRMVLRQGNTNAKNYVRCALGLMKLPKPWKDLDGAKACILKALEIAPKNPMANHVAGNYFKLVNDYNEALHYLSKAAAFGVFGAEIDLINLKLKQNKLYDPEADFKRVLDIYQEKPYHLSVCCEFGMYYYKMKNDFKTALKYWMMVIEEDIGSDKLKLHFDNLTEKRCPVNINKIVITEILKLLDEGRVTESERQLYDEIITKYINHHPGLVVKSTNIDVSKYENKNFKYISWKNEFFGKTLPLLKYRSDNDDQSRNRDMNQDSKSSRKDTKILDTTSCATRQAACSQGKERKVSNSELVSQSDN